MPRISLRPKLSFTKQELDIQALLKDPIMCFWATSEKTILRSTEVESRLQNCERMEKKSFRFWVKEGSIDESRFGIPQDIIAESRALIVSLACMKPKDRGLLHEI
jgi:putative transposase